MTINNTSTIATAAAAGAQDVTHLEPLVCFILYFYFNTLMFILALGTIAMAAQPVPAPPPAGAPDKFYVIFYYTNDYFRYNSNDSTTSTSTTSRRGSRCDTSCTPGNFYFYFITLMCSASSSSRMEDLRCVCVLSPLVCFSLFITDTLLLQKLSRAPATCNYMYSSSSFQ